MVRKDKKKAVRPWYFVPWLTAFFLCAPLSLIPCFALDAQRFEIESPGLLPHNLSTRPGDIRALPDATYYETLLSLLENAGQSVDISMFLFKTSDRKDNRPGRIAKALIAARERGVRVRVILENSGYDEKLNENNKRVADLLKKNRILVEFDSPRRTNHSKVIVVDRRYCLVGSHNLTHAALAYNHEVSLLIDSRALARELLTYMDGLTQ